MRENKTHLSACKHLLGGVDVAAATRAAFAGRRLRDHARLQASAVCPDAPVRI